MSVCPKCGAEVELNASFCENCGAAVSQHNQHPQKGSSVMGDKNVVAGDVIGQKVAGDNVQNKIDGDVNCSKPFSKDNTECPPKNLQTSPMLGDKNVVAGDVIGQKIAGDNVQNKIMGNVIYNVIHEDAKMPLCSICNRHLSGEIGHTCSNCGKIVCDEHFDEEKNLCLSCADDIRQKAMCLYEQLLISINSEGKKRDPNIDQMLNEKRAVFGLTQYDVSTLEKKYNLKKETVYVALDGSADFETINDALAYAEDGFSIIIKNGKYDEELVIDKDVSIIGEKNNEGNVPTIVSSKGVSIKAPAKLKNLTITTVLGKQIVLITSNVRLETVSIVGGSVGTCGICIDGEGVNPLIEKCEIYNNGTGIRIKNKARGLIKDCKIYENFYYNIVIEDDETSPHFLECQIYKCKKTGVDISNGASGKIEKCNIFDNSNVNICIGDIDSNPLIVECEIYKSKMSGIFIYEGASGKIENCDIYKNQAGGITIGGKGSNSCILKNKIHHNKDGIIAGNGASGKVEDCDLYENRSTNIYIHDSGASLDIKNCKVHKAAEKGVLISSYASGKIENCDIYENQLNVGVQDRGSSVRLYGCKIHNAAEGGVAIASGASGKVENCDLYENHSTNISIINSGTSLGVKNCKIHNAAEIGVAIASGASGKIEGCDIYENKLCNISALKSESSVYLYDCKIHDGKLGIGASFIKIVKIEKCEIYSHDDLDIGVEPAVYKNNIQIVDSSIQSLNQSIKTENLVKQTKKVEKCAIVAPKEKIETKKANTVANQSETPSVSKKSNLSTNIDWSKETPTTIEEWNKLSPEQKQDWVNWHRNRSQFIFATIAILIEIILSIIVLVGNEQGVGVTILIVIATLAGVICTGVFRKILYKVLRALVAGGLTGTLFALLSSLFFDEEPLHTVSIVLSYALFIAVFGIIESKGGMDRKIPKFPQK